jgi:hypothetical protein
MGFVRDTLTKSIGFFQEEIMPLRGELYKAGILTPEQTAYDQKASLVDPWAYGQTAYGYKERYALLDYNKLRHITYADPVVSAIMQTRTNQVSAYATPQVDKYKPGFKIKLRDPEKEPSDQDKARMREIAEFICNTGVPENFEDTPERKRRDNFETFLRKITRDSLTFDQINFEITPRRDGRPYAFTAVDAATIRVVPDIKEDTEKYGGAGKNSKAGGGADYSSDWLKNVDYSGASAQKMFNEFEPSHPRYAQVIQGAVRHVFDEWEMAFGVRNPRTDIHSYGYGFSEIEMLIHTITSHMNAETYNRKFFTQGSTIKGILSFEGSVPPDQLEMFRRQWYAQATAVENAWRTPIMSLGKEGKMNWQDLQKTNKEMEFGTWMDYCVKTICAVFQMDPIEIGFDISKQSSGQGNSGGLGEANQSDRINFSQDKGLRPLLVHIQTLINDYIVHRIDPNFEFEFVGLNAGNEKDELDQIDKKVKTHKTINEIRAEQDLEPLPEFDKIKSPGDTVLDASLINWVSQQMANAQMEEQQAGEDDGGPLPDEAAMGPEGAEEEPDYENMSVEELEAELAKLEGRAPQEEEEPEEEEEIERGMKVPGFVKSFFKELDL